MNLLQQLRIRFEPVLSEWIDETAPLLAMILPAQNPQHGDYQANFAMPLAKRVGKNPRDVASELIERVSLEDICEPPEVAGPGFINFRIKTDHLHAGLTQMFGSERLDIAKVAQPETIAIDYSSPNVAKPMHVGHLRSTVIGAAIEKLLEFLGHNVISDNHVGDWGTQFGMILYGYRNFVNTTAYEQSPVDELARLYRLVNQLTEYHNTKQQLSSLEWNIGEAEDQLNRAEAEVEQDEKKGKKRLKKAKSDLASAQTALKKANELIQKIESDSELAPLAAAHPDIHKLARTETSKLHAGDADNRQLWEEFLPVCLEAMQKIYQRLDVEFDHTLGESFYDSMLAEVVESLEEKQLSKLSEGAVCVFVPGLKAPMIVKKQDGAYTYATTDLATIKYRVEEWKVDRILYVVDFRQSEHFQMLFEVARLWGFDSIEMKHVAFGTVMGKDGKPFKTREGDAVGLASLLDEAVERAAKIVGDNDDAKPNGPELTPEQRQQIANIVGTGGIKYADLHHNRESDYVFDWDKMLSTTGDTATYMQYAYARVSGIFRKANLDKQAVRELDATDWCLEHAAERALALQLLRFEEALVNAAAEYRPNLLTNYLYETAKTYSSFFDQCPVVKEPNEAVKSSRLRLCDLTARVIEQGLHLLGIQTSETM